MAGIDIHSDEAVQVLRGAHISERIIRQIRYGVTPMKENEKETVLSASHYYSNTKPSSSPLLTFDVTDDVENFAENSQYQQELDIEIGIEKEGYTRYTFTEVDPFETLITSTREEDGLYEDGDFLDEDENDKDDAMSLQSMTEQTQVHTNTHSPVSIHIPALIPQPDFSVYENMKKGDLLSVLAVDYDNTDMNMRVKKAAIQQKLKDVMIKAYEKAQEKAYEVSRDRDTHRESEGENYVVTDIGNNEHNKQGQQQDQDQDLGQEKDVAQKWVYTDFGLKDALQLQSSGDLSSILKKTYPKSKKDKEKERLEYNSSDPAEKAAMEIKAAAEAHAEHIKVCQRCFRLHQYGQIEDNLRPGKSKHELLTPEHFTKLLKVIRETSCVVLCLIDMFDLEGTMLKDLKEITGKNPVIIAANKFDLLPQDVSETRLLNWIQNEFKLRCDFKTPREMDQYRHSEVQKQGWVAHKGVQDETGVLRRQNIHLISCTSGYGLKKLMDSTLAIAKNHSNKIYVMGAANVGKSSFINKLLETSYSAADGTTSSGKNKDKKLGFGKSGKAMMKSTRTDTPTATVSNLPGTTLNFIKIKVPTHDGVTIYDTPGLLNANQLTTRLNTEELRKVIPNTPIMPVTFRIQQNKAILIGGLAQVELVESALGAFYMTFFISNEIKLHPTNADIDHIASFINRHLGSSNNNILNVPSTLERREQLGPYVTHDFNIIGNSWNESSCDIVIAGLGWVAITGPGSAIIRITAPQGIKVSQRAALLPFEAHSSTVKFSGGRILKKSKKAHVKGREIKTYGWRA